MKNDILQIIENSGLMIFDGDFLPDELDENKIFILSEFDRFIDWIPEEEGEEYSIELPIIEVRVSERGIAYHQTTEYIVIDLKCVGLYGEYTDEIDIQVESIWRY